MTIDIEQASVIFPPIFGGEPGLRAAMSTKIGGVSGAQLGMNLSYRVGDRETIVDENRARFLGRLGSTPDRLATAAQCHSADVVRVNAPVQHESCDSLITNRAGIMLAVTIADCVPILIYDPVQRVVAAVHAGWRGTAAGIVRATIFALQAEYGCRATNLLAYVGPGAGACCYAVGTEVSGRFEPSVVEDRNGVAYIDLKEENKRQLMNEGVAQGRVFKSPECTICNAERFHSYRRDGNRSGRMMAVIGLF